MLRTVIQIDPRARLHWLAELLGIDAQIAEDSSGQLWLRVQSNQSILDTRLAKIAGRRFTDSGDGWLLPPGAQVASCRLDPQLKWKRLDDELALALPPASLAGKFADDAKTELRLVRGGEPQQAAAAIIDFDQLSRWASNASQLRLRRLKWIVRDHDALVLGQPLPPIEAYYLVARGRLLIPAGWKWTPEVSAPDVAEVFGINSDQWLVWERNGSWSIVPDDAFAAMRRGSIRAQRERAEPRT